MDVGDIACTCSVVKNFWRDLGGKVQGVLEGFYGCQRRVNPVVVTVS